MPLSHEEILARIKIGREFVKTRALVEWRRCHSFRDPDTDPSDFGGPPTDDKSLSALMASGEELEDVPVGVGSQQTANVLTKVAAIAIGNPALRVTISEVTNYEEPERFAQFVEEYWKSEWRAKNWQNECHIALIKQELSGVGLTFYRWDDEHGFMIHTAHAWDVAVDPFVRDWKNMSWAAVRINMSLRTAIAKYGKAPFEIDETDISTLDSEGVQVWTYWDQATEAIIYNGEVIASGTNEYGRVPVITLMGDPDPNDTPFPLSNVMLTAGIQREMTDVQIAINNSAKNGQPITIVNEGLVSKSFTDSMQDAKQDGWMSVRELPEKVVSRIGAENIGNAPVMALQLLGNQQDGLMGVSGYDRGVKDQNIQFATEAAMMAQRSGSRAVQSRTRYETYLRDLAEAWVTSIAAFGGPKLDENGDPDAPMEAVILWEACSAVTNIEVGENSTTYRDPAAELQPRVQMFQVFVNAAPVLAQFAGIMPNFQKLIEDILRSAGISNVEDYVLPMAPPQMQGPPTEGQQVPQEEMTNAG